MEKEARVYLVKAKEVPSLVRLAKGSGSDIGMVTPTKDGSHLILMAQEAAESMANNARHDIDIAEWAPPRVEDSTIFVPIPKGARKESALVAVHDCLGEMYKMGLLAEVCVGKVSADGSYIEIAPAAEVATVKALLHGHPWPVHVGGRMTCFWRYEHLSHRLPEYVYPRVCKKGDIVARLGRNLSMSPSA